MDAGKLRELITIQTKAQTGVGDRGQLVYNWTQFAQTYAEIESLTTGKKQVIGEQLIANSTHTVTVRYVTGLTPQMRVVDSYGTTYQIQYIGRGQNFRRYFEQTLYVSQQTNGIQ